MVRIVEGAQRVFEGVIFDIYQWQQEMFDGTFKTFEAAQTRDIVQVIMVSGDTIVITRQKQPGRGEFFGLFGGSVDHGEDTLTAALRELKEESGIVPQTIDLWWRHQNTGRLVFDDYFYIARGIAEQVEPDFDQGGEYIELYPVTFEEFLDLFEHESFYVKDKFQLWVLKNYILNGKQEELRKILFGEVRN